MTAQTGRVAIQARQPQRHGGGICTLLLIRRGAVLELLPHASDKWAAELDEDTAGQLSAALAELVGQ